MRTKITISIQLRITNYGITNYELSITKSRRDDGCVQKSEYSRSGIRIFAFGNPNIRVQESEYSRSGIRIFAFGNPNIRVQESEYSRSGI
ncbi:MAG: hypothetical protein LBD45_03200 [Bacteroidales bacterium]|nr:hypothetical protein [Bacteroidales bacterium]